MGPRSEQEIDNCKVLQESCIPFGSLRPTRLGLDKAILDATIPFREFLTTNEVHDFRSQQWGREHKLILPVVLVHSDGETVDSSVSLYLTSRGDQRLWFRHLPDLVAPEELVVCLWAADRLWVINGSRSGMGPILERLGISGKPLAVEPSEPEPGVFEELLERLRRISSKGFIAAPVDADTAVGRLLESELGIRMNSAKEADYHGIEIKSSRRGGRRYSMFSQVPDWSRSSFTGSAQILDAFGYDRPEGRTLSCTVSVRNVNSQGLFLHVDRDFDLLRVRHNEFDPREVVQWDMAAIQERMRSKHAETVWVDAEVRQLDGREYLRFDAIRHTRGPIQQDVPNLLRQGHITVDFLIRQDGDKGYPFKIAQDQVGSLFEHSKRYMLSR